RGPEGWPAIGSGSARHNPRGRERREWAGEVRNRKNWKNWTKGGSFRSRVPPERADSYRLRLRAGRETTRVIRAVQGGAGDKDRAELPRFGGVAHAARSRSSRQSTNAALRICHWRMATSRRGARLPRPGRLLAGLGATRPRMPHLAAAAEGAEGALAPH